MDDTEKLLKDLTEAHGVPGYETEVRAVLRGYMDPLGDLSQDKLGSLICHQAGDGPRVLLMGHMDEIGFIITHVTKDGFLKFRTLGGWWDQVLLGNRVAIKTRNGDVLGLLGAKPPHLLTAKERGILVGLTDMYIDIGASNREDVAEAGIRVGDAAVPVGDFAVLANPKTYLAKAFDNRVGCAVIVDVLKLFKENGGNPNDLYGVQSVMEEIGVRGATTSVRAVDPDVAIVLEADIAGDVPGIPDEQCDIKLGGGPSVMVYDLGLIPNLPLRELVIETADELDIPLQFSNMYGGSNDGRAISMHGIGVPTVVVSVPARHIHSHGSIIHRDDYDRAVELVTAVVAKLDLATVAGLTE